VRGRVRPHARTYLRIYCKCVCVCVRVCIYKYTRARAHTQQACTGRDKARRGRALWLCMSACVCVFLYGTESLPFVLSCVVLCSCATIFA
jgi:hypothetical protein